MPGRNRDPHARPVAAELQRLDAVKVRVGRNGGGGGGLVGSRFPQDARRLISEVERYRPPQQFLPRLVFEPRRRGIEMAAVHPAGAGGERAAEAQLEPAVRPRLQDDEARGLVAGLDQHVAADRARGEPDLHVAAGGGKHRQLQPARPVVALLFPRGPHVPDAEDEFGIEAVERLVRRRIGLLDRRDARRPRRMTDAFAAAGVDPELAQPAEQVGLGGGAAAEVDHAAEHEIDALFAGRKGEAAVRLVSLQGFEPLARPLERLDDLDARLAQRKPLHDPGVHYALGACDEVGEACRRCARDVGAGAGERAGGQQPGSGEEGGGRDPHDHARMMPEGQKKKKQYK